MKDKRPVNLDIGTIHLPVTAITSILHRASGVFLVAGVAVLLWMLDTSLSGEQGFNDIQAVLDMFLVKLVIWIIMAALIYHSAAGVRHLVMDLGIGESMAGGIASAKIVFVVTAVLVVLVGALIW